MRSYYEILEVSERASGEVIEKAYRVLAKKYHPDLQAEENKAVAEESMKEINEAYEVLTSESKRQEYDQMIEQEKQREIMDQVKKYSNTNASNETSNYSGSTPENYSNENNTYDANMQNNRTIYYTQINKNILEGKVKTIFEIIIAIALVVFIVWILWLIPPSRKWLVEIYNENEIVKFIANIFLSIFNIK